MGQHAIPQKAYLQDPAVLLYAPQRTLIHIDSADRTRLPLDQPSTVRQLRRSGHHRSRSRFGPPSGRLDALQQARAALGRKRASARSPRSPASCSR